MGSGDSPSHRHEYMLCLGISQYEDHCHWLPTYLVFQVHLTSMFPSSSNILRADLAWSKSSSKTQDKVVRQYWIRMHELSAFFST